MKLLDFVNHLKHNSIVINLYVKGVITIYAFKGTLGEFKHWVKAPVYYDFMIHHISCYNKEFNIFIE